MNTHKIHQLLQWATALLVVSSIILTLSNDTNESLLYLYFVTLVFTLNHLFVGLESIILDYVHNKSAVTSFLVLIRICSLSLLIISGILIFFG